MKQTLIALALALPLMACSDAPKEAPVYGTYSGGSFQQTPPPPSEEEIEQKLSDAQTQSAPQEEDGIGSEVAAGVAGAAVGALAMSALSNNNRSSGYEVEKCDWDDHPNEPECRGTAKYYKWKAEQDRKAKLKAEQRKKVIAKCSYYKRKK
jgi:hypothetical protein